MKKILLAVCLVALAGCQDSMESSVRSAMIGNHEILVPGSAELRELREAKIGDAVCGLVSYEGKRGRTDFVPFVLREGRLELASGGNLSAEALYEVYCSTSQPAQK